MSSLTLDNLTEKIIRFAEKINERDFRPYQRKRSVDMIHAAILNEGATLTNLWARQSGKTEMIKATSLALMSLLPALSESTAAIDFPALKLYKFGYQVALAGPKLATAQIPFNRLRRQLRRSNFQKILAGLGVEVITSNSVLFELSNGSVAQAFSGSETASNEGPGADLLLIDEASMVSQYSYYKILRPMVAANNGTICMTGTPWRKRCPFLADIDYNKRHRPHFHYEVPYLQVIKESPQYAAFIEEEIRRLPGGADNPFFQMNYNLMWMLIQGHFVEYEHFAKLALKERFGSGEISYYAGVDWGKIVSATVAVILEKSPFGITVVDACELRGDYDDQFAYLVPFLKSYNCSAIFAEAVGTGDPLCSRLKNEMGGKDLVFDKFMSAQYKDRIFTQLNTLITGKPPQFYYLDNGSREMNMLQEQFLDAEQEIKAKLLSVHKSDKEGALDDFLYGTAIGVDACLSAPHSGKIEFESSGHKREIFESLRQYTSQESSQLSVIKDY